MRSRLVGPMLSFDLVVVVQQYFFIAGTGGIDSHDIVQYLQQFQRVIEEMRGALQDKVFVLLDHLRYYLLNQ